MFICKHRHKISGNTQVKNSFSLFSEVGNRKQVQKYNIKIKMIVFFFDKTKLKLTIVLLS